MLSWIVLLSASLHLLQEPSTQEKPGQETVAPNSPTLLPSDPKAISLLEGLILVQATEKELPPVQGFSMLLDIRIFDPEGGNEFLLELGFRSEPMETVRLALDDASRGTRIEKGFDPDGFWLRDADGNLIALDSHEFEQDREAIDEAMVLCNDFLLLFDLKRLKKKASQLQLKSFEEKLTENEDPIKGQLISGQLKRGRESWGFELLVPAGSKLPTRLSLQPPPAKISKSTQAEQLSATDAATPTPEAQSEPKSPPRFHYVFGDWTEHEGRLLPSWIEEFSGDDLIRPIRLMEIRKFAWRDIDRIQTRR
jgi:hypothetical protein